MAPRLQRRNHGKSHSYTINGAWVPGVTSVIGVLDKPALVAWAANETAAYADEHWAELSELRSADRIERLKKARFQTNRKAIVRGNRVHALGERVSKGEQIDEGEIDPALRPWIDAYARFLDDWDIEILHTEIPVGKLDYLYAGTADAFAYSPRLGTFVLDLKTGKGVYSEVGLQLAAYRYADIGLQQVEKIGPRGGVKTEWQEVALPDVDGAYVAHLHEDSVEFHEVKADQQTFESFLYLREIYDSWVRPTSWDTRNSEEHIRIIGDPIYPEDRPLIEGEEA